MATRERILAIAAAKWWAEALEANNDCFVEVLTGLIDEQLEVVKTITICCTKRKADPIIKKAANATSTKLMLKELSMVVSIASEIGVLVKENKFIQIHR